MRLINLAMLALVLLIFGCANTTKAENSGVVPIKNSEALYQSHNGNILTLLSNAKKVNKAIIVAHRGGIAPSYTENSRSAIERSLSSIPVILEIDVVASRDGINFLHHDKTLERTTTGFGKPSDYDWLELSKLRLKDQSNQVMEESLLTFTDFLHSYAEKTFLMIDMKAPSSDAAIVEKVREFGILKSVIFIAYSLEQAKSIRKADNRSILALGTKNSGDLDLIRKEGFADQPFILLSGNIQQGSAYFQNLSSTEHYVLAGSYIGNNSLDATIEGSVEVIESQRIFDSAIIKNDGVTLIVSNQPFAMSRFLCGLDLLFACNF